MRAVRRTELIGKELGCVAKLNGRAVKRVANRQMKLSVRFPNAVRELLGLDADVNRRRLQK